MQEFFQNTDPLFFTIILSVLSFIGLVFSFIGFILLKINKKIEAGQVHESSPSSGFNAFKAVGIIFLVIGPLMLMSAGIIGYFWHSL